MLQPLLLTLFVALWAPSRQAKQQEVDDTLVPAGRGVWGGTLKLLERQKIQLVNWGESVPLLSDSSFPNRKEAFKAMILMFFNPNPNAQFHLRRLPSLSVYCSQQLKL